MSVIKVVKKGESYSKPVSNHEYVKSETEENLIIAYDICPEKNSHAKSVIITQSQLKEAGFIYHEPILFQPCSHCGKRLDITELCNLCVCCVDCCLCSD